MWRGTNESESECVERILVTLMEVECLDGTAYCRREPAAFRIAEVAVVVYQHPSVAFRLCS